MTTLPSFNVVELAGLVAPHSTRLAHPSTNPTTRRQLAHHIHQQTKHLNTTQWQTLLRHTRHKPEHFGFLMHFHYLDRHHHLDALPWIIKTTLTYAASSFIQWINATPKEERSIKRKDKTAEEEQADNDVTNEVSIFRKQYDALVALFQRMYNRETYSRELLGPAKQANVDTVTYYVVQTNVEAMLSRTYARAKFKQLETLRKFDELLRSGLLGEEMNEVMNVVLDIMTNVYLIGQQGQTNKNYDAYLNAANAFSFNAQDDSKYELSNRAAVYVLLVQSQRRMIEVLHDVCLVHKAYEKSRNLMNGLVEAKGENEEAYAGETVAERRRRLALEREEGYARMPNMDDLAKHAERMDDLMQLAIEYHKTMLEAARVLNDVKSNPSSEDSEELIEQRKALVAVYVKYLDLKKKAYDSVSGNIPESVFVQPLFESDTTPKAILRGLSYGISCEMDAVYVGVYMGILNLLQRSWPQQVTALFTMYFFGMLPGRLIEDGARGLANAVPMSNRTRQQMTAAVIFTPMFAHIMFTCSYSGLFHMNNVLVILHYIAAYSPELFQRLAPQTQQHLPHFLQSIRYMSLSLPLSLAVNRINNGGWLNMFFLPTAADPKTELTKGFVSGNPYATTPLALLDFLFQQDLTPMSKNAGLVNLFSLGTPGITQLISYNTARFLGNYYTNRSEKTSNEIHLLTNEQAKRFDNDTLTNPVTEEVDLEYIPVRYTEEQLEKMRVEDPQGFRMLMYTSETEASYVDPEETYFPHFFHALETLGFATERLKWHLSSRSDEIRQFLDTSDEEPIPVVVQLKALKQLEVEANLVNQETITKNMLRSNADSLSVSMEPSNVNPNFHVDMNAIQENSVVAASATGMGFLQSYTADTILDIDPQVGEYNAFYLAGLVVALGASLVGAYHYRSAITRNKNMKRTIAEQVSYAEFSTAYDQRYLDYVIVLNDTFNANRSKHISVNNAYQTAVPVINPDTGGQQTLAELVAYLDEIQGNSIPDYLMPPPRDSNQDTMIATRDAFLTNAATTEQQKRDANALFGFRDLAISLLRTDKVQGLNYARKLIVPTCLRRAQQRLQANDVPPFNATELGLEKLLAQTSNVP